MPVVFPADYTRPAGDRPLDHARVAHAGNWIAGALAASSVSGLGIYDVAAPANDALFERWKPAAVPATWSIAPSAPATVDYCAVAAHDLAAAGAALRVQYRGAPRANFGLHSEDFSQPVWMKTRGWFEWNVALAPDGVSETAYRFVPNAEESSHYFRQDFPVTAGQDYTISVFVRPAGLSNFVVHVSPDHFEDSASALFDLAAGEAAGHPTSFIDPIGGGWFRVGFTRRAKVTDPAVYCQLGPSRDRFGPLGAAFSGDGASGVDVWGFQIEAAAAPSSYVRTDAAPVVSEWHDLAGWIAPDTSEPLFVLFAPVTAAAFRVELTGNPAAIGWIRFGRALQMETRSRYPGRIPVALASARRVAANVSARGNPLALIVERSGRPLAFEWTHLSEAWVKAELPAFLSAIEAAPFLIADRPGPNPEDLALCWLAASRPRPAASGIMDLHDLTLSAEAFDDG